jgi:thiamine biosynthesis protein ThiI
MENFFTTIIVHYDELGLKGNNRDFFINKLIRNIKNIVGSDVSVKNGASKILITGVTGGTSATGETIEIFEKLRLIPGISSFSPATICETDLEKIKEASLKVLQHYSPKTFKIETVREYKAFPLKSPEVSREVGGFILQNTTDVNVDVHHPELLIKLEIEHHKTLILGKKEIGVGGLPIGTGGKLVCLLSGGIDSPVAAFEMMKRGAEIIFVHFQNKTINKVGVESKIKRLVEKLSAIQGPAKLFIIPFENLQKEVIKNIPAEIRMIVYRRLMFKIAAEIAQKEKALALVTGDSFAQVASQTLENLSVVYSVTPMLKLAPLIGRNKLEIIEIAKKIGTLEISNEPYGDCCSLLLAKHPETHARLAVVENAEKNLENVETLISQATEVKCL